MTPITIYSKRQVDITGDDITWEPIESKITHDKIVSTTIISGRNQPFGGVEVKLLKNIFGHLNVGAWTETNLQPQIVNGESTIDVDTFGSVKGYVITNVTADNTYTTITAYHPAYKLTYTDLDKVFDRFLKVKHIEFAPVDCYKDGATNNTESVSRPIWAMFDTGTDFQSKHTLIGGKTVESGYAVLPTDQYRAMARKGCTKTHNTAFSTGTIKTEYEAVSANMFNLSKYASGSGYEGVVSSPDKNSAAFNKYTFWYNKEEINLIFHVTAFDVTPEGHTEHKYSSKIEWIEGRADDIIRFILKYTLEEPVYPQHFTHPTKHPTISINPNAEPKKKYTNIELEASRTFGPNLMDSAQLESAIPTLGTPIGDASNPNTFTERVRIRVNNSMSCGTLLHNLALFTNRSYSFTSEGFYMTGDENPRTGPLGIKTLHHGMVVYDFNESDEFVTEVKPITTVENLLLDAKQGAEENWGTEATPKIVKAEKVVNISLLQDNGAEAAIDAQFVEADNYQAEVYNSSVKSMQRKSTISLPFVDSGGESNRYRNRMAFICAFNVLVNNYKHYNNITYQTTEIIPTVPTYNPSDKADGRTYFLSMEELLFYQNELDGGTPAQPGDIALIYEMLVQRRVKFTNVEGGPNQWILSNYTIVDRTKIVYPDKHKVNSVAKKIKDNFNGLTLKSAPLGLIVRTYPYYNTEVTWGKSEVVNIVTQGKSLKENAVYSKSLEAASTIISDKPATSIVMGSQTATELSAEYGVMDSFTGIQIEKSSDSESYRLVGYDDGVVQAFMDSHGRIVAGRGAVILDEYGINIGDKVFMTDDGMTAGAVSINHNGVYVDKKVYMNGDGFTVGKSTSSSDVQVSMDETGVHVADKVVMNKYGFIVGPLYEGVGAPPTTGLVVMNESGITVKDKVLIDGDGFTVGKTANDKVVMNDSGVHAGKVTLNNTGLKAGTSDRFVTVTNDGVRAGGGSVELNHDGLSIADGQILLDKTGIHAKGYEAAAGVEYPVERVLMNQYGFIVGPAEMVNDEPVSTGQVVMNELGVHAGEGNVLLNSGGLYVGPPGQQVKLEVGGVYAGDVLLSHAGLSVEIKEEGVVKGEILVNSTGFHVNELQGALVIPKVLMNQYGFIVGPDDVSVDQPIPNSGQAVLNKEGIQVGAVKMDKAGVYVLVSNDDYDNTKPISGANQEFIKTVSIDANGFKAGAIGLSKKGISVNGKVLMNEYGVATQDKGVFINDKGMFFGQEILTNKEGNLILVGNHIQMGVGGIQLGSSVLIDTFGMIIGPKPEDTPKFGEPTGAVDGEIFIDSSGISIGKNKLLNEEPIPIPGSTLFKYALNDKGFPIPVEGGEEGEYEFLLENGNKVPIPSTTRYEKELKVKMNRHGIFINPNALHADKGDVMMTEKGVRAGHTLLDKDGFHIQISKDLTGFANDHVLMNASGLLIGPTDAETGAVTVKSEGIRAGNTLMNSTGFHIQKNPAGTGITNDHIVMDSRGLVVGPLTANTSEVLISNLGVRAGKVLLDKDGLHMQNPSDADVVLMNGYGLLINPRHEGAGSDINTGDVVVNANGLTAGLEGTKITIDKYGLKIGTSGTYIPTDGIYGPAGKDGVSPIVSPYTTMTNEGIQIVNGSITKAVMNQNGFIVGPTGGSAGASTGKVVMNEIGVVAGPILLDSGGLHLIKDGFLAARVCSNGFIINPYYNENDDTYSWSEGDVTLKEDGLTVYTGGLNGYSESRAIKFRGTVVDGPSGDVARMYVSHEVIDSVDRKVFNIRSFDTTDLNSDKGLIRIYNRYTPSADPYSTMSLGDAGGVSTNHGTYGDLCASVGASMTTKYAKIGEYVVTITFSTTLTAPLDMDAYITFYMGVVNANGNFTVNGTSIYAPKSTSAIQVGKSVSVQVTPDGISQMQFKVTKNSGSPPGKLYVSGMQYRRKVLTGAALEIDANTCRIYGDLQLKGVLSGNFDITNEVAAMIKNALTRV